MITTIGDTHGKHQGMVEITNMHHNGKMQIDTHDRLTAFDPGQPG